MKVEWQRILHTRDGEEMLESYAAPEGEPLTRPLTLGRACSTALLANTEGQNISPTEKSTLYGTWFIVAAGGDVTAEQIVVIKERVGLYGIYLCGLIWQILEGGD